MPTAHPDFWLVRQVQKGFDNLYTDQQKLPTDHDSAHAALEEFTDGLIDVESLIDAATERVKEWISQIPPMLFLMDPVAALQAVWSDAFMAGVRFQNLGGHVAPKET